MIKLANLLNTIRGFDMIEIVDETVDFSKEGICNILYKGKALMLPYRIAKMYGDYFVADIGTRVIVERVGLETHYRTILSLYIVER